jgi:hypothetical protein
VVLDTLAAADRANLLELYARSVMLLDLGRCEEWADLFESRAIVRSSGVPGDQGRSLFTGREELLQLGLRTAEGTFNLALGPLSPRLLCRHVLSNVCLYADGARHARGYAHLSDYKGRHGAAPLADCRDLFRPLVEELIRLLAVREPDVYA